MCVSKDSRNSAKAGEQSRQKKADHVLVHTEEGDLTGAVKEIGEADEGVGHIHVEQENSCDERHALNLQHSKSSILSANDTSPVSL